MKKLIKEKTTFLTDMLEGLSKMNTQIEVIADTVVVRKEKKKQGEKWQS